MIEESLAPPTRFDLSFRLGDIPIRVHPYFWLTTCLLGLDLRQPAADILSHVAVWTALVFVSVLVHELGHVLMGRFFGSRGHILLTGFCGLAVGSSELPQRSQRIAVLLAGPGAGFLLAGVVAGIYEVLNPGYVLHLLGSLFHVDVGIAPSATMPSELLRFALYNALWINIFWGLVNLLPIWPLDGGQICREICQAYRGREGLRLALQISVFTAGGLAALALLEVISQKPLVPFLSFGRSLFSVLFFALFALNSWQALQHIRRVGPDWEDQQPEPREPWEQDADWWKRGENPWRD